MTPEAQFLRDVLVWPGDNSPGYINLHTNVVRSDTGKPIMVGWAFNSLEDFSRQAAWVGSGTSKFFNTWMCMSQQSESIKTKSKYLKAVRAAKNATWVKALWVDVDIKAKPADWDGSKPWSHYETGREAWTALKAFFKKVGLPSPSAVVNSGGGLHLYWISDTPLTTGEWHPYADGLKALLLQEGIKCDAGLTTDVARLLRVPGTLNHKYEPPQPVAILKLDTPYSFSTALHFLKNYKTTNSSPKSPIADTLGAPDPAFATHDPQAFVLGEPTKDTPHLIDPAPVFASDTGCPWLREAKETGGVSLKDQPQWNIAVLCTAFMEGGNEIAHKISDQSPYYKYDDAQALYERKVRERAERNLGYPQCSTINGLRSDACKTCPLFGKIKSPLNLRPVTATVTAPTATTHVPLPEDYTLDGHGRICLVAEKKIGRDTVPYFIPMFKNEVLQAHVNKNPDTLRMLVKTDLGSTRWATFLVKDLVGMSLGTTLLDQGVVPGTSQTAKIGEFFMSFLDKMWRAQAARPVAKFGWYRPTSAMEGFSFGGTLFKFDGTQEPSSIADAELAQRYSPIGGIDAWHTAASYIFRQERPDFEAIIAVAFASPIMQLTGDKGGFWASMGDKGAGKSYALDLASAVWGNPDLTKEQGEHSTPKSLMHKMGKTVCLPAFWDEVSEPPVQAKVFQVVQPMSGGADASRLNANVTQKERGTWCTIININGNVSFRAYCISKQRHGAALRRMLETWSLNMVDDPNAKGQVPTNESQEAKAVLSYNYGNVGFEYAEFLSKNFDLVQATRKRVTDMLVRTLLPTKEESMWLSLCTCILTGAELATQLPHPVSFNMPALTTFVLDTFKENREFMKTATVTPTAKAAAEGYLVEYLKHKQNDTIWTEGIPAGRGRAKSVAARKLQPNVPFRSGIHVHWDTVAKTLWICQPDLQEWCAKDQTGGRDYTTIVKGWTTQYKAVSGQWMTPGKGTEYAVGQQRCIKIDVAGHADLEEMMNANMPADTSTVMQEAAE